MFPFFRPPKPLRILSVIALRAPWPRAITTKDGRVRNGSLIYTIRPIQEALELNYQRQFLQVERDMERARAEKRLAELNQQNKKGEESA